MVFLIELSQIVSMAEKNYYEKTPMKVGTKSYLIRASNKFIFAVCLHVCLCYLTRHLLREFFAQLSKEVVQLLKAERLKVLGFVFKDENHHENFFCCEIFSRGKF